MATGQGGSGANPIPPSRAMVLGAVQGPAELLPVSSSAHLTLLPWLANWDTEGQDAELRKSFEIALHAGAAAALVIGQRRLIIEELRSFDRRRASVIAASSLPAAAIGVALERPIERHLGGPLPTAIGLLVGAAAMALADRMPQRPNREPAGPLDGLALGLAQASALVPGVSRNGATLTAARARGFSRERANLLSRTVALPVIVAAAALKGARLRRRGLPREQRLSFAAGTATSFASTLASQALIRLVERDSALWPYSAYRAGLAGVVLWRLHGQRRRAIEAGSGAPTADQTAPGKATARPARGEHDGAGPPGRAHPDHQRRFGRRPA